VAEAEHIPHVRQADLADGYGPADFFGLAKSWSFWMPCTLTKAAKRSDLGIAKLEGLASVGGDDYVGEDVLQTGLDWSYWAKNGSFKWRHGTKERPSRPEEYVGLPNPQNSVEIVTLPDGRKASKVHGYLLDTAMAREIAELAEQWQKAGRQLGFSVEGGTLQQQGTKIQRAIVIDVAIDPHPMHPDARMTVTEFARSLMSALGAGHPAPAAEPGAGAPLIPQSIEGKRAGLPTAVEDVAKGLDDSASVPSSAVAAGTPVAVTNKPGGPTATTTPPTKLDHDGATLVVLKRFPFLPYAEASALAAAIIRSQGHTPAAGATP
jgi:hypothetical protein